MGSVLSFLPIIVVLFFFLSILEDTGYMARVAFVMDQLLRKIGLSGRSIVPMLIGFGCSVPAIMSTRTLASRAGPADDHSADALHELLRQDPHLRACSPPPSSPSMRALVMIGLYVLGILVGIVAAKVLGATAFRGNPVPFVMELPNYRFPSAKSVGQLCWDKAKDFLTRAFTIIFVATIIVWFLQTFDTRLNLVADSADSLLATIGRLDRPRLRPPGLRGLAGLHRPDHRLHRQGDRHLHPGHPHRLRRAMSAPPPWARCSPPPPPPASWPSRCCTPPAWPPSPR